MNERDTLMPQSNAPTIEAGLKELAFIREHEEFWQDEVMMARLWAAMSASALSQPSPAVPDEVLKAIGGMLNECMERAVQNGANSVSMPDEYVHVAAWLCGIPQQDAAPQPTEPALDILRQRPARGGA